MIVQIAGIPEEGLWLKENLDAKALKLESEELKFSGPIAVSAFVQKQDKDLFVEAEVESGLSLVCGRCLEPYAKPYHETLQMDVPIKDQPGVDVSDDIRQEIILTYPMNFMCQEDCKGLCQTCGKNLNEGQCNCASKSSAEHLAGDAGNSQQL